MIDLKDLHELFRAGSATLISSLVKIPDNTPRTQLDGDLFIRLLQNPVLSKGTVLMIRGGAFHMGQETHYMKLSCKYLPEHRIYTMEKLKPMVNFEFSDDIRKILVYLRSKHEGPLIVLGFSMGGILTWTYLGNGNDHADLYVPVSAPINMPEFKENIDKHFVYRWMKSQILKGFNVKTDQELLRLAGYTPEQQNKTMTEFIDKLKRTSGIWKDKCHPVSGSEDTLFANYQNDLRSAFPVSGLPHVTIVQGGTHCCIDVIWYACKIIRTFTDQK